METSIKEQTEELLRQWVKPEFSFNISDLIIQGMTVDQVAKYLSQETLREKDRQERLRRTKLWLQLIELESQHPEVFNEKIQQAVHQKDIKSPWLAYTSFKSNTLATIKVQCSHINKLHPTDFKFKKTALDLFHHLSLAHIKWFNGKEAAPTIVDVKKSLKIISETPETKDIKNFEEMNPLEWNHYQEWLQKRERNPLWEEILESSEIPAQEDHGYRKPTLKDIKRKK